MSFYHFEIKNIFLFLLEVKFDLLNSFWPCLLFSLLLSSKCFQWVTGLSECTANTD